MKIIIHKISNRGDYDNEYITLKVNGDCDAGDYMLADTTYTENGQVSSLLRHLYWLPDKAVKAGDFIQVHTKKGTRSSVDNKANTKTHKFYWGLKTAVWNDDGDCGVLFEIKEWQHKDVK